MEDNNYLKSTESIQSESVLKTGNGIHKENSIKSTAVTNKSENKSLENNIQTVNCYW